MPLPALAVKCVQMKIKISIKSPILSFFLHPSKWTQNNYLTPQFYIRVKAGKFVVN